ncbi:hypothetical protein ASPWEDRAFT_170983 [Aspergillus wentii DTO 134E9]|uniref:Uncharacterized protein n=1 Tax=Aspergillus wentii DTO 134E9 TaxID=1073089 RepID=A0A1L9RRH9_ASPWE|nr:uncharacterized protein ASPWEDRAFT_170983 [Aspergillus wentii DTO 134E9]KAI9930358.1 hypothetical protein MW887_011111 [Aspergillus wentii]OJJ37512.1 hypothetical protein ASPWEDRAFT_170983 [Aspergillus wentii DTO 134E9]
MAMARPFHAWQEFPVPHRLEDFARRLKAALNSTLPSETRYEKVSVLALRWANDQMGVDRLEAQLLQILHDKYQYDVESFVIPTAECAGKLSLKLSNWSNTHSGQGTLRIYVYTGHAAGATLDRWYLGGTVNAHGDLNGPRVDWNTLRAGPEGFLGDVCYLFGCCSAGPIAMEDGPETIFSFTQDLIDVLQDLNGDAETLAGIHARMFRNARQNQASAPPVYIPKNGASSITLARLGLNRVITRRQLRVEHRVLLSIRIRDQIRESDLQQWTQWLTNNIPSDLVSADVKIESVFHSEVLLVTVPVEIWIMLPGDDPSISFVAHVTSNNVLPQLERSPIPPLPFRPLLTDDY